MKKCLMLLLMAATGVVLTADRTILQDPYGICAHVNGGSFAVAPQKFAKVRELNCNWVRTDFEWKRLERSRGRWDFSRLDSLVSLAGESGIHLLPILDYDTEWASPAWKNLDAWGNYVRKTVKRYAKDLRYWEVYNEQNARSFWRGIPDGRIYTSLLKRSYQEIKAVDPSLTVLYGGTAGVPLSYIEDTFRAGATAYFDVMNIHPYHWQGTPEMMISELEELRALMRRYNAEQPIWITEVGWSTAQPTSFFRNVLPAVFHRAGIEPASSAVAIVSDPANGFPDAQEFDSRFHLSCFQTVQRIPLSSLKSLDPKEFRVLIPSLGESFPSAYYDDLIRYLQRGGTLLLPSGLPFYYDLRPASDGRLEKVQINMKAAARFHIGWETHWTRKGVPEKERYQRAAPSFTGKFNLEFAPAGRFLTTENLKAGDRFIPVVEAGTDSYKGVIAALYQLNSDLKGNIIVCTKPIITEAVPELRQAELLPRTFLTAFACGIQRIFWYKLRSGERKINDRESHFGILRKNLDGKPAFDAYRTLTRFCPSGSTVPELRQTGGVFCAGWIRPDGSRVWAVWSEHCPLKADLNWKGELVEARDLFGNLRSVSKSPFTATPQIVYLIGPESLDIHPFSRITTTHFGGKHK